jgi:DNA-damage-inducible protein J
MSSVTVRLDDNIKKEADQIVQSYGLDLPTAVRMFLMQIVRTKAIDVNLKPDDNWWENTEKALSQFDTSGGTSHELIEV